MKKNYKSNKITMFQVAQEICANCGVELENTSLPNGTFIVDINQLAVEKRIEGISEVRDESDREEKVRVVIEHKKDANARVILNQLYKYTQMQDSFGIIMLALVNNVPKILTLRQCLDYYIDHRKTVILRRTKFDLDKALARAM